MPSAAFGARPGFMLSPGQVSFGILPHLPLRPTLRLMASPDVNRDGGGVHHPAATLQPAAPGAERGLPRGVFTVDVEDYFQVTAFERCIRREDWHTFESRVEQNTHRILGLLHRHSVVATFFVLGWVAKRYPQLVREIHCAGHEVGSHSSWHRLIYEQAPREFRQDLVESRDVLSDTIGQAVTAFRAPTFSITRRSLWALDILVEEGFTIDSSIVPARHDRYGIPGARPVLHLRETAAGSIVEFPPTIAHVAGLRFPAGGGGYFRLYPRVVSRYLLARTSRALQQPFMFYIHPWEVDPSQPRLGVGSRLSRFRHYVNLHKTEAKLDWLLQRFSFIRMSDAVVEFRASHSRDI